MDRAWTIATTSPVATTHGVALARKNRADELVVDQSTKSKVPFVVVVLVKTDDHVVKFVVA